MEFSRMPLRLRPPISRARKLAFLLASVSAVLTILSALLEPSHSFRALDSSIGLFATATLIYCTIVCLREPYDAPWRYAPVVICVTSLALTAFLVPA